MLFQDALFGYILRVAARYSRALDSRGSSDVALGIVLEHEGPQADQGRLSTRGEIRTRRGDRWTIGCGRSGGRRRGRTRRSRQRRPVEVWGFAHSIKGFFFFLSCVCKTNQFSRKDRRVAGFRDDERGEWEWGNMAGLLRARPNTHTKEKTKITIHGAASFSFNDSASSSSRCGTTSLVLAAGSWCRFCRCRCSFRLGCSRSFLFQRRPEFGLYPLLRAYNL